MRRDLGSPFLKTFFSCTSSAPWGAPVYWFRWFRAWTYSNLSVTSWSVVQASRFFKLNTMTIKLQGILTDVFPYENFNNFTKRVFWLKQPDTYRYPEHWEIQLHNDDGKRIDEFKTGDTLEAEVEVRGKKWNKPGGKEGIIVSLKCIGLRRLQTIGPPPATSRVSAYRPLRNKDGDLFENDEDL